MPGSEVFADVAALLPDSHREKFLVMATKLSNVPEDDEYLQILEAIGFMTLIWKEIPNEIQAILKGVHPVTETNQSLSDLVRAAVESAIPSNQDLRQITQSLAEHQLTLKQAIASVSSGSSRKSQMKLVASASFFAGMAVCWILTRVFEGLGNSTLTRIIEGFDL